MIWLGGELERQAGDDLPRLARRVANGWIPRVPTEVVAHIKVEVAVAIEVGKGRRGGPAPVAAEPGAVGHVLERPIAPVPQKNIGSPPRDEQIDITVVVKVTSSHTKAK